MVEWWNTPKAAWGFVIIGIGGGVVLTYLSPVIGIPIGIALLMVGILLLIRAYRRANKVKEEAKPGVSSISIGELMFGAHAHKCSKCGWGITVNRLNRTATCPKCGNVDNIEHQ